MASPSKAARLHRALQEHLKPRVSPVCPDFAMPGVRDFRKAGREDLQHHPKCPNYRKPEKR